MEHGTPPAAKLCETVKMYLVGLDQNEDVVHPNGQHQEWDDFNHNEGERDPSVAEDAQRARHRAQHDEDTRDAKGDFRIYLRNATKTESSDCFLSYLLLKGSHFYPFTQVQPISV